MLSRNKKRRNHPKKMRINQSNRIRSRQSNKMKNDLILKNLNNHQKDYL